MQGRDLDLLSFRSIAESLAESVLVSDPEGRIRYTSPPIEALTGYTPEALRDTNVFDFLHPDDRDRARADLAVLVEGGELPGPTPLRLVRADGTVIHAEASGRSLLDDPSVGGMVITVRNVTDRIEIEERIRNSEKLEAIGRLAGGIAHDFNNILTAIVGHAELILTSLPADHPLRSDLGEIRDQAVRAGKLTERLLAFAGRQILIPRTMDISTLVEELEPEIRRILDSNIEIVLETKRDCIVDIDAGGIREVILHMARNAANAMPSGGKLRLSVFAEDPPADSAGGVASEGQVILDIEDTGHGMDAATKARIFEPFFTTRPMSEATGLGLAVALGIVEQSGGSIEVESTPGAGTRFRIRFRRARTQDRGSPQEEPKTP